MSYSYKHKPGSQKREIEEETEKGKMLHIARVLLITLVYKKKIFSSVMSTKVGELNSIFYAEFKYVLSFCLSLMVFK
jgi:hypothetical protein